MSDGESEDNEKATQVDGVLHHKHSVVKLVRDQMKDADDNSESEISVDPESIKVAASSMASKPSKTAQSEASNVTSKPSRTNQSEKSFGEGDGGSDDTNCDDSNGEGSNPPRCCFLKTKKGILLMILLLLLLVLLILMYGGLLSSTFCSVQPWKRKCALDFAGANQLYPRSVF